MSQNVRMEKKYPKISIITPSFNQGMFIEETIQSVFSQNYPNLEYIIIDGGSSDNSVEIIKKYEHQITYWISEKDKGQSDAINKGLRIATGEIVTWINSDDLILPGILLNVPYNFSRSRDTGLIYGRNIPFGMNIKEVPSEIPIRDLSAQYLGRVAFPQPASFFKREVILEQGYLNESLNYGMDYDLFVRIALNYNIIPIDVNVSKYRFHKNSKSVSQNFLFAEDWARVFSKLLRSFTFTEKLIENMKSLDLYDQGADFYSVKKSFSLNDIKKAYLYFLQEQIQCYYGDLQLKKAFNLAQEVRKRDYKFYKQYKLDNLSWRCKYWGKSIIKLLRLIK